MKRLKNIFLINGCLLSTLIFFLIIIPVCGFTFDTSEVLKPGDLKPGDVITKESCERLKGYVPPCIEVVTNDFDYVVKVKKLPETAKMLKEQSEATKKYGSQVTLSSKGGLVNYVAGIPFDPKNFDPKDPNLGLKIAWNMSRRWFGGDDITYHIPYAQPKGDAFMAKPYRHGTGYACTRRWVIDKKGNETISDILAFMLQTCGRLRIDPKPTIPGYENIEYMRMYRTLSPRDVSGTASLEVRYWDPDKGDDFWIYIPSIRRVRRLPTSARSSTRAPADYCWDDGAGWSGKTPSFNWKYLGERKILRNFPKITPFRHERGEVMAPSEDTDWYLGDAYIIEQTPKDPKSYLIPKRFYQVNKDSFCMAGIWVFDKKGELWKSASTIELISYNANGETGLTGGGFNTYMDHQAYHFTLTDSMHLHGDQALDVRLFSNQNILRVSRGELTLR